MKVPRSTQGATLIIVVLLTLLILTVMLMTTMKVGLTSRQNSGDQKAILTAQYAAESQVSLARSRLRDMQTMLSAPTGAAGAYLHLPEGTTSADLQALALKFCGKTGTDNAWQPADEFSQARTGTDTELYAKADKCQVDDPTTLNSAGSVTADNFSILASIVQPQAYQLLPGAEQPAAGADLGQWWKNHLTSLSGTQLKYAVSPTQVVKLSPYRYRFYLGMTGVNAAGGNGTTMRYVSGTRTNMGDWWFELSVPSPFDYVNFMNTWPQESGGWFKSIVDGNYFTNDKPRFLSNQAAMTFYGNMDSAGCTTFPASTAPAGTDCPSKLAGFFNPYDSPVPITDPPGGLITAFRQNATFSTGTTANFQASYIPLPTNASNQSSAAMNGGLTTEATETALELFVGDSNGNTLTNYDVTNGRWVEPSPTYQYIRFRDGGGKVTREYRVDAARNVYLRNLSLGSWSGPVVNNFNGVIYSTAKLQVSGPGRLNGNTSGDLSQLPPALASFSEMNVVSTSGLDIASDLTLSDTPCNNQQVVNKNCTKNTRTDMPRNVLGLFTSAGNVTMTTATPDNVTLHASIMASGGGLTVQNYLSRPNQGKITVTGNVIVNTALPTNSIDASNALTGYETNYSYDNRFRAGVLPPYPPIVMFWRASDAAGAGKALDLMVWRQATAADF